MKKIALCILAFSSSLNFAGTMGPVCNPDNVTVPCPSTAWDLGVQALYLKPTYSGNQYHYNFLGYSTSGDTINFNKRNNDWNWAFRLEGSYHFGTGADINVNWVHFDHEFTTPGISYVSLISGNTLNFAYDKIALHWNSVNAEFGQHANFGLFKDIRFHAGVQYAYLKRGNFAPLSIFNPNTGVTTPTYNRFDQKFSGAGPRLGMDLTYNFTNAFAVYGKFAGALIIGDSETNDTSGVPPVSYASTLEVIPELEAKLGLTYTHNLSRGTLIADAGYMVVNYFSVFDLPQLTASATNLAFQGPYAGLKWIGNLA
ncbi:major outer membrane protein [Legionella donaldsonii]|uniref:Major outer membrane protein n=1 Tax=Legionella donaldsonii TaxID=45060 RepID=A0A378JBY0_9GAMM|nr:Lpg1974 family pore-forming outer membrane protein [Legionella donaldsonii]STX44846.1 major outer membrane protein [Legionella donaldsonii]